ncbi:MAG: N-acetyl-D-muramate 6-phosphate phosphatase [Actinomycetota bacterium]|jgi:phosphoglycolate phosphatase-like HAD superfamily hydrolase|nr:N-acetyl-D-muramate 6-phosphate phosphatase [Actinomycetota bacterium]
MPLDTSLSAGRPQKFSVCVFDVDGTLLDSDAALLEPFLALGVPAAEVTFGHVLADECARLGIDVADYLAAYRIGQAEPYPGVPEVVARLDRWAVCSNKDGPAGRAELDFWGWHPTVALFADDFGGPKQLGPVLEALGVIGDEVLFVGDTAHDRTCATASGAGFALAGWNPRAVPVAGDIVLDRPADVLGLLDNLN